jgi:GTP-binding protein
LFFLSVYYTGQIIGEHNKDDDLVVNAQKAKRLTNMRAAGADRALRVAPAVKLSLEESIEFLNDDEYVEVTPKRVCLRKSVLDESERKLAEKAAAK